MNNYQDIVLRLKAIFDAAVDGIIIINSRGVIEEVNPASCKLFGYDENEIIGNNVSMLMPVKDSIHHNKYIQNYHDTGKGQIIGIGREVKGKKRDGEEFPFWLAVIEVKLEDRVIFTGFIHDLTEIKKAESQLISMNEELENKVTERTYELENVVNQLLAMNKQLEDEIHKKEKAQEKLREREAELKLSLVKEKELGELKSRFVSMASHEFRTPLATVLSSVSLISRYTQTEQQANRDKHIQKIKSSVTHLTGILNDFLSMNKLEEGKVVVHKETFDVKELCEEVVEEMQTILKGSQKIICIQDNGIFLICNDRKILKNILINLISNAIKYSDENGMITCHLVAKNDQVIFKVQDQGIGIPEVEQKHLFDRFFRASNVTNIEGTGLGLHIVKKYVEILGGTIEFESKLYSGTTFTIQIPSLQSN
jgi:two-component system, LuxR family, sensor kinase FixL